MKGIEDSLGGDTAYENDYLGRLTGETDAGNGERRSPGRLSSTVTASRRRPPTATS